MINTTKNSRDILIDKVNEWLKTRDEINNFSSELYLKDKINITDHTIIGDILFGVKGADEIKGDIIIKENG